MSQTQKNQFVGNGNMEFFNKPLYVATRSSSCPQVSKVRIYCESKEKNKGGLKNAAMYYDVVSIADLMKLPVGKIADDDSILCM